MKLLTLLTALSAVVLLTGTVAVAVPFDITTADGNGADTYVNDQQPDVNHSADDHMIAWDWLNPGPGVFLWYKMYTRFDLSAIAQPLSSAKLTCTTLDGQFPPGTSIWALDDGDAGEAWVEADITWNNAPANDTAGNGFLSNATYVGDFENINPVAGGTGDFSGAALKDFVNADTDGLATFMILSPGETVGALLGDLNEDVFVGQADLDIVLGNWGQAVPPADPRADPSGDNFVGQDDLDTVLGDWGQGTLPPSVPEPATVAMLAVCGLALLRRRPKSR